MSSHDPDPPTTADLAALAEAVRAIADEIQAVHQSDLASRRRITDAYAQMTDAIEGLLLRVTLPVGVHAADSGRALSNRERKLLRLLAEGYGQPQIARTLQVAPRTVARWTRDLRNASGARTDFDLAIRAVAAGWLLVPRPADDGAAQPRTEH
jgi:DNA-binding NarL/FixJ family response regulator